MRINKLLISLSVIAIAMTACVKEDHSLTQEQSKVTLDVNFDETNLICNMDDLNEEETRTTVGDETGVTYLYWGYRESVGVYGSTTKNSRFRTANVTPSRTAQITGTMSYGDTPRYAYYPYNSANTQNAYTAVASHLPINQTFDTEERELTFDFKVAPVSSSGGTNFTTLMTYLRLVVNATNTELQGDKLESISFIAPEGRSFGGDFTVNLATQKLTWGEAPEGANVVTVTCPNNPVLGRNVTEVIYITCAPGAIKAGDDYQIVIRTDKHIATIDKTLSKTLAGKTTYKNTLTLSSQKMTVSSRVAMTDFRFNVADNDGKILGTELHYDGSKTIARELIDKAQKLAIDEENKTISTVIPYLYNFHLVPTFTTTAGAKVYYNGEQVVSGETSIDFSQPVEFVVKAGIDEVTYTVDIRNSGLPVVVLSQNGREGTVLWSGAGIKVNDKPAEFDDIMTSSIAVYNADGTVDLEEATCAFRLRGNSSYGFPKKPFAIKLNSAANILGIMPEGGSHKRWVLLANYIDRSLMRNAIINKLANLSIDAWKNTEGAEPGLIWNPSGQSVELVIDGRHVGNYYLTEQVKIDEHRLNINEPWDDKTNTSFAESGYLLELEDSYDEDGKFLTKRYIPVLFKDETPDSYRNTIRDKFIEMEQYLKTGAESRSVTESDDAFAAAFEHMDLSSWIDNWLLHEIAMNAEYKHPKSVYMYMNGDSKIFGGPVWDFDYQTFPNVSGVNAINNMYKSKNPPAYNFTTSKWLCEVGVNAKWYSYGNYPDQSRQPYSSETGNVDTPYLWFPWLLESDAFKAKVKERWEIIKPYWLDIYAYITMFGEANAISQEFNNAMWPVMSDERLAHSWYIEYSGDEDIKTWEGVIDNFRTVFTERFNAMDTMIQAFPSAETN